MASGGGMAALAPLLAGVMGNKGGGAGKSGTGLEPILAGLGVNSSTSNINNLLGQLGVQQGMMGNNAQINQLLQQLQGQQQFPTTMQPIVIPAPQPVQPVINPALESLIAALAAGLANNNSEPEFKPGWDEDAVKKLLDILEVLPELQFDLASEVGIMKEKVAELEAAQDLVAQLEASAKKK